MAQDDDIQHQLLAHEIALDALLAEIQELRDRIDRHARVCPAFDDEIQIP